MVIDVIDMEDAALGAHRAQGLDSRGVSSTRITMYGMCNGVGQMISDIRQRARVGGVDVLRIWSHGRPGGQTVSGGHAGEEGRVLHWTGISVANIGAMRPELERLRPYFAPGARVELRGCNVAGDADGERLLQQLAQIWGVRVQAGTLTQTSVDWVGPVYESTADGAMSCTTGTNPPP